MAQRWDEASAIQRKPYLAAVVTIAHFTLTGAAAQAWIVALVAFNLGIETVQLLIVICVVPVLAMLARTYFYSAIRITSSVLAMAAASYWIIERSV